LGTIMTVSGLGMFLGSVLLSAWGGPKKNKIVSIIGFAVMTTIGLAIAGLQANPFFIGTGFFLLLFFVPLVSGTSQAIFQTKVPLDLQGRVYAMRSMISRSIMPLAFLTAGPLADYIFEPLMAEGGALSSSFIARMIGVGPGRGIGLLFLICAFGGLVTIASVWGNKKVRRVETDIPDVITEAGD